VSQSAAQLGKLNSVVDDESEILQVFGRNVLTLSKKLREYLIEKAFLFWRERGFPYPIVSGNQINSDIKRLRLVGSDQLQTVLSKPSTVGLRTANAFHPQMWHARVRGRSPVEVFADDDLLRNCLAKAIRFWPNRRCWNERAVRILMSLQNRVRVSNFRPTVARSIVSSYSRTGETILDFSAGYGGRLLGAITLPRHYVGIDPARDQCKGLRSLVLKVGKICEGTAEIKKGCAENILPRIGDESVSLIFSSPPYYNLEKYNSEPSQSYIRHSDYESWLQNFLEVVVKNSHRILKPGGYLVINVANTNRYRLADDTKQITNKIFGKPVSELAMNLSSNPADKKRSARYVRTEPIVVYRK